MKKIKDFNFRLIGNWPGAVPLAEKVQGLDPIEWERFTLRQKTIVGHKFTKTIPLIFDWQKKHRQIFHANFETFEANLNDLSDFLIERGEEFRIQRANLVLLMAGHEIKRHMDKGDFLLSTRRLHVPLASNPECSFVVGDETMCLGVGDVWEIDNTGKFHSVHNLGTTDRIHLIVDVL